MSGAKETPPNLFSILDLTEHFILAFSLAEIFVFSGVFAIILFSNKCAHKSFSKLLQAFRNIQRRQDDLAAEQSDTKNLLKDLGDFKNSRKQLQDQIDSTKVHLETVSLETRKLRIAGLKLQEKIGVYEMRLAKVFLKQPELVKDLKDTKNIPTVEHKPQSSSAMDQNSKVIKQMSVVDSEIATNQQSIVSAKSACEKNNDTFDIETNSLARKNAAPAEEDGQTVAKFDCIREDDNSKDKDSISRTVNSPSEYSWVSKLEHEKDYNACSVVKSKRLSHTEDIDNAKRSDDADVMTADFLVKKPREQCIGHLAETSLKISSGSVAESPISVPEKADATKGQTVPSRASPEPTQEGIIIEASGIKQQDKTGLMGSQHAVR
ncbi:hypothetical protein PTNB73_05949 [Pyrenophora teres f. teres]|uniref:Uncharacterized protein n=2 Tax=Pyrenophora teres f. teres TaxID=97479 RepID=E3RZ94_PYRTT|nr:hypothetical protein PTT_14946 [Pyrenophora teres f. teres 0-1]KAE8859682.1 hypothetical protein PTNB29_06913 [Pyrenophora teres f. teres]KAE8865061.1 hypothetical protein PTNB73_05949 [Pyrenophora teres f. teres]CAE7201178.1 hypothetical protein PTTW11_08796 [Pyrenophora teres f. teres]